MQFSIQSILVVVVIAIVSLIIYNLIKKFILEKLRPSKWLVLILLILSFFGPMFFQKFFNTIIGAGVFFALITILTLTFMDILKFEKIEKNKPVVGKPKPKPNRAKNTSNK